MAFTQEELDELRSMQGFSPRISQALGQIQDPTRTTISSEEARTTARTLRGLQRIRSGQGTIQDILETPAMGFSTNILTPDSPEWSTLVGLQSLQRRFQMSPKPLPQDIATNLLRTGGIDAVSKALQEYELGYTPEQFSKVAQINTGIAQSRTKADKLRAFLADPVNNPIPEGIQNTTSAQNLKAGRNVNSARLNLQNELQDAQAEIGRLGLQIPGRAPSLAEISNGVPAAGTGVAPTFTPPTATATNEAFYTSMASDLDNRRQTLEATYNKQLETLKTQSEAVEKRMAELTSKQEGALGEIEDLSAPFRADLEKTERERLKIEENFFANQALTNELGSLLTEGNTLIQQMKGVTGLAGIRNPRVAQTIEGVNARVGVISAVMAARSGQIAEGYRLIDRSLDAMNADRTDQLNYYKTLFNFYETARTEEGAKLLSLKKDEKEFLNAQIKLIEGDLARAQTSAEAIKIAMTDPDTALAYAQAGITLNDTPAQINKKLADYGYMKELTEISKDMSNGGYTLLVAGNAPAGATIVQRTDSKGVVRKYWKKGTTTDDTKITDVALKQFINKQIATDDFKALSKAEKKAYIQSQGGDPTDYDY